MMVERNVPQPPRQIPTADDWRGYETDLDVRDAHRMMFGKTNDRIQSLFHSGSSISRASELLFMRRKAFQYDVFGFAQYLMTDAARGESDSASPFLHLLVNREKRDPAERSAHPRCFGAVYRIRGQPTGLLRRITAHLRQLSGFATGACFAVRPMMSIQ